MGLNAGIVGLPNVGKSTLFNALTRAGAKVENFPFCTIDPHHGIVALPDRRLDALAKLLKAPKVTPAPMEVVDIAGLVRGAHKGEGLGNQFLGHIRNVDALLHVVRCFGGEIAHVEGSINPVRDVEVVELELALADLETVERKLAKMGQDRAKGVKGADSETHEAALKLFAGALREGRALRTLGLDDGARALARELGLLTAKPVLYVANIDESQLCEADPPLLALREYLAGAGARRVELYVEMEMEIAELEVADEREAFLVELGLEEPGLDHLAREAYALLGLITYYTFVGAQELRAWPIPAGEHAPRAAGRIHTDFERGFIRADVIHFDDYIACGTEHHARDRGLLHSEGKEYVIQDGDVVHFRFNV